MTKENGVGIFFIKLSDWIIPIHKPLLKAKYEW